MPRPSAARRRHGHLTCHHERRDVPAAALGGNVVIQGVVSAMTESLRLLGVGRQQYQRIAQQPSSQPRLPPGDVPGIMQRLTADFDRAYFVTGVIDDSIYVADCVFADPTVRFSGLDLWKRNLQLLVPFLIAPDIQLLSLARLGPSAAGAEQLQAEWTLRTTLSLPWRPYISIVGRTVYTLNDDANQVIEHVEYWDVSAARALLQLVTPGGGRSASAR